MLVSHKMSHSTGDDPPVFQTFKSEDDDPLDSLLTHISEKDGRRYVLWSDIQAAFKGIDSLANGSGERIWFLVDGETVYVFFDRDSASISVIVH